MDDYDLERFIDELLIPDLKKMVAHQLHYYAFAIICQAVEVLGSVFDQKDIADFGESETRFRNGLRKFFKDQRYRNNQSLLFEAMRGPLIHQLRPGDRILLASEAKDNAPREWHLKKEEQTNRVYMVIEQFLDDFIDAYSRFKAELRRGNSLDSSKFTSTFISVYQSTKEGPPFRPVGASDREAPSPAFTVYPSVTGKAVPDP